MESNNRLYTKLYGKRADFDFHIVNFLFLSSNIPPSSPSYDVYISQLIRYARCCSYYDDFGYRYKRLVDRLLSQGYEVKRLRNSFKKFYGRYPDLSARSEFFFLGGWQAVSLVFKPPPSPQIFSVISETSCHTSYLFFKNTNCVTLPQIIFANLRRFPPKLRFPKNFDL